MLTVFFPGEGISPVNIIVERHAETRVGQIGPRQAS